MKIDLEAMEKYISKKSFDVEINSIEFIHHPDIKLFKANATKLGFSLRNGASLPYSINLKSQQTGYIAKFCFRKLSMETKTHVALTYYPSILTKKNFVGLKDYVLEIVARKS